MTEFVNRTRELEELNAIGTRGGLVVVYGRRRVGKTRLLTQWLRFKGGLFAQAIEGAPEMQVEQIFRDLTEAPNGLRGEFSPKNWLELFEILHLVKQKGVVCIDEFPYLVQSDPTLPSVIQRFVDHKMPRGMTLVLAGSSMRMMHDTFLNRSAPLYGRARKVLPVRPMSYVAFAEACQENTGAKSAFEKFSLVGGIPKYWEFVVPRTTSIDLAESLFFGFAPYFSEEPARLLRDESIAGLNPLSILEAIGRGAERPSEIASRMGSAQPNLTRIFDALVDASLVSRSLPFGESARTTKRVLYRIADPSLRFHFHVYSPHRARWRGYSAAKKAELIAQHVGSIFETWWRAGHPGSAAYWEPGVEFDAVRLDETQKRTRAIVTELKWGDVSTLERARLVERVQLQWERCALAKKYGACEIEIVDAKILKDTNTVRRLCEAHD